MEPTDPIPNNVRLTQDLPSYPLTQGTLMCVEGRDPMTGQLAVTDPGGDEHIVAWSWVEPVQIAPVDDGSFHIIVETGGAAPDLEDLVRLIRYCRDRDILCRLSGERGNVLSVRVGVYPNGAWIWHFVESVPLAEAYYVGPDGTVYDCNGEALP